MKEASELHRAQPLWTSQGTPKNILMECGWQLKVNHSWMFQG